MRKRGAIFSGAIVKGSSLLHSFIQQSLNSASVHARTDELMMNWFCGMVGQWKTFSLISRWDHYQRFSSSHISNTQVGFKVALNQISGFVEWSCSVVITTAIRCHTLLSACLSRRVCGGENVRKCSWLEIRPKGFRRTSIPEK